MKRLDPTLLCAVIIMEEQALAEAARAEQVMDTPQPICAVLAGNLYNDDMILSVAHRYQSGE